MRVTFLVKQIHATGTFLWSKKGEFETYEDAAEFIASLPDDEEETRYLIEKNFVKEPKKQKYCGAQ